MNSEQTDVLLVGGGIMSATLGVLLMQLDPSLQITIVERLDDVSRESSDGWNNAGTGHAGYCELNYTPGDGHQVDISKALAINAQFDVSLQWWSSLLDQGHLEQPGRFINAVPHLSFVWGEADVAYLRQRHRQLQAHHLFSDLEYSESPERLAHWMPLVMARRQDIGPVAATRVDYGTDVDFGALTRSLIGILRRHPNARVLTGHTVKRLKQEGSLWQVTVQDGQSGARRVIPVRFVFLGAGGGALPLLLKSRIPEGRGYGGFPVSGQWLVCRNPALAQRHHGKVYGKAPIGAPPMSVPHLDTRLINGEPGLLFGPFAGFTTRFLKEGSRLDLFKSVRPSNVCPMMSVGLNHFDLTRYLIREARQSHEQRMASLQRFFPEARPEDWTLAYAGQRVQIIKKDPQGGGRLEFGTEVVAAADGSLAALLGASPGASIAPNAMLGLIERCFPQQVANGWGARLRELVPARAEALIEDPALARATRTRVLRRLNLV